LRLFCDFYFFVTICRIFNVHYIVGDFLYYFFYNSHYKYIVKSKFQFSYFFPFRSVSFFGPIQKKKTIFFNLQNSSKMGSAFFSAVTKNHVFSHVYVLTLILYQNILSKARHNFSFVTLFFFLFYKKRLK